MWFNMLLSNRMKVIMGSSYMVFAVACSSPKAQIDSAAIRVTEQATEARLIAEDISTTTQEPETASKADEIVDLQVDIIETASEIRTELHGVQDTTPWWARMVSQFSIALITIGVIILLWQTGIGMFIKKLFWAMGLFIPARAIRSAEVDAKVLDEENPLSNRESIAVRRTSDPAYEYALKKVRNRR